MKREIVKIDEEKCNGCGLCVPACAEGAIQMVNGKAKLIAENLCDGLGACLGDCPQGAITVETREADAFDEEAVEEHLAQQKAQGGAAPAAKAHGHGHGHGHGGGCPSARLMNFDAKPAAQAEETGSRQSQLRQWPVQMHLVPPTAPFLKDSELVLAADCVPFAYADFHKDFLKGQSLLIGCPKLDDGEAYLEKMTAILKHNNIKKLTVLHMEVPCCTGLIMIAKKALEASGASTPLETVRIGIQGDLK